MVETKNATGGGKQAPDWTEPFLKALRAGGSAAAAARAAGIDPRAAFRRRSSDPAFAAAWAAIRPFEAPGEKQQRPYDEAKLARFFTALAESSNVSAAAAAAGIAVSRIYALRREDPDFARRWYAALAEGYDNLEMELLGRLRTGDDSAAASAGRKIDTATALRCLAAHRESVAREKGRRTLDREVATIATINARIDQLRLNGAASDKAIRAARASNRARLKQGEGDEG